MYNALSEEELPFIFITIDNFDIVKDEMHELESEFVQLSRDGQSLGIYFMLTATRVNAVRQSLLNNLKTKVVHYLMDQSEGYSIYGRPKFNLEPNFRDASSFKRKSFISRKCSCLLTPMMISACSTS